MIDAAFSALCGLTLACSIAVLAIVAGRPLVRRRCGAVAAMRLWWLLPVVLAASLLPRQAEMALPVTITATAVAAPVGGPQAAATEVFPVRAVTLAVWLAGAIAIALSLSRLQRRFVRRVTWPATRGSPGRLAPGDGPAMVGAIRPRLALPADFRLRYTRLEQRLIVLHERMHATRHDGLANLGMTVLVVLQWFNALAHWAARALVRDQESACDAAVLARHPEAIAAYAGALMKTHPETQHLPMVSRWQAHHSTVERIAMLKMHRATKARRTLATLIVTAGAVLAGVLVHAATPAAPVNATLPSASRIHYRNIMAVKLNGAEISNPTVKAPAGAPASIEISSPSGGFHFAFTVSPIGEDVEVAATISVGKPLTVIASPRLVTPRGTPMEIPFEGAGGEKYSVVLLPSPIGEADLDVIRKASWDTQRQAFPSSDCAAGDGGVIDRVAKALPEGISVPRVERAGRGVHMTLDGAKVSDMSTLTRLATKIAGNAGVSRVGDKISIFVVLDC